MGRMLSRYRAADLLALTDLAEDAEDGCWLARKGAAVSMDKPKGKLCFPVNCTGSYRLALTIGKLQEAKDIHITFPVGERTMRLTLQLASPNRSKKPI